MEKAFGQLSPDRAFDLNKQLNQQDFEAKKEYAKALLEKEPFYLSLSKEFGLQALKWLFLINVGAIGAILAYIGASSEGGALSPFKPFLKTMWYFGGGIAAVILSSLAGYLNYLFLAQTVPAPELLKNFLITPGEKWPQPRGQREGEDATAFYKRNNRWIASTQLAALLAGVLSLLLFLCGVFRLLKVALR